MRRRLISDPDQEADVNVTPLLDVVFILLIFFIVTATFLQERGIALISPEDTPPETEKRPPPTLLLTVQRDGFVRVDNLRLIDPRSVSSVVEEFKARQPQGVVLISSEPDALAETTVAVLDQGRRAGVEPAITVQRTR